MVLNIVTTMQCKLQTSKNLLGWQMTQELVQTAHVAGLWHGLFDVLDRFVIYDALFVGFESFEIAVLFMKYLESERKSNKKTRVSKKRTFGRKKNRTESVVPIPTFWFASSIRLLFSLIGFLCLNSVSIIAVRGSSLIFFSLN